MIPCPAATTERAAVSSPHPREATGHAALRGAPDRAALVLRLLAARHLCQAAITAARPSRHVYALGAAVDLLHATSCLGLAVADRRWRHFAMAGALGATAFGIADAAGARMVAEQPPARRRLPSDLQATRR